MFIWPQPSLYCQCVNTFIFKHGSFKKNSVISDSELPSASRCLRNNLPILGCSVPSGHVSNLSSPQKCLLRNCFVRGTCWELGRWEVVFIKRISMVWWGKVQASKLNTIVYNGARWDSEKLMQPFRNSIFSFEKWSNHIYFRVLS